MLNQQIDRHINISDSLCSKLTDNLKSLVFHFHQNQTSCTTKAPWT